MKAAELYRNAIVAATCDQIIETLKGRQAQLKGKKGSWVTRILGVQDAIVIVEAIRKETKAPKLDKEKNGG